MDKGVRTILASLPKGIRIGGHDWAILTMLDQPDKDREDILWGTASANKLELTLYNTEIVPSASTIVGTFLHEILHAVWYNQQIPVKAKEEDAVRGIENGLVQVFRDNPWLLDWIKKGLK